MINIHINKIKSKTNSNIFFSFTISGDTDMGMGYYSCFFEIINPKVLYLTELNPAEAGMSDYDKQFSAVKNRVIIETKKNNLVSPKVIRIDKSHINYNMSFKRFLKKKSKPPKVFYQCVYDETQEAIKIGEITVKQFIDSGGEIICVGDFEVNKDYI